MAGLPRHRRAAESLTQAQNKAQEKIKVVLEENIRSERPEEEAEEDNVGATPN